MTFAIETLAGFIVDRKTAQHPGSAVERAENAFLDTLGCIIVGAHTDHALLAYRAAAGFGEGTAPVHGTETTLPPPWAAMVNGVSAHACDFDDYTLAANDHASAVLVPAVLAAAEMADGDVPGPCLLDAYLVGLEIIMRVGALVNMGHYNLGWHTTSTIDGFGATAAVCRLWGLNARDTAAALSLTTSMGAGYVSQFGTFAKPLHAGLSAKTRIVAAGLGRAGATACPAALDGPISFASLLVPEGQVRSWQSVGNRRVRYQC